MLTKKIVFPFPLAEEDNAVRTPNIINWIVSEIGQRSSFKMIRVNSTIKRTANIKEESFKISLSNKWSFNKVWKNPVKKWPTELSPIRKKTKPIYPKYVKIFIRKLESVVLLFFI